MSFLIMLLVFLTAFLLTRYLCSNPISPTLLDYPNERSLHFRPTPRTGGLAILTGVTVGFAIELFTKHGLNLKIVWILAMTLFLGFLSFWDVKSGLRRRVRLIGHFVAASGIVLGYGLKIHTISLPMLGSFSLGWFSIPVSFLFIVWVTNLYNFMDGMDGLAGGMTVIGFGFLGLLAWMNSHFSLSLQSGIIAAAGAGFLFHNLPPAKIFMGDVGSIPIGFLASIFILSVVDEGLCDLWVPLLIFSPFIVDSTATLLRRLLHKKKFWMAHREHYYQRIALAGGEHSKTVLAEYVLMLASGWSALIYEKTTSQWQLTILIGWIAIYMIIAYGTYLLEIRHNHKLTR